MKDSVNKKLLPGKIWATAILLISLLLAGCGSSTPTAGTGDGGGKGKGKGKGGGGGAVPVVAATVARKDVPVEVQVVGSVEAYVTVSIKAQMAGQLEQIYFQEGDYVKKGAKLFSIDSRPLTAQLAAGRRRICRAARHCWDRPRQIWPATRRSRQYAAGWPTAPRNW